jgi:putative transposase
MVRQLRRVEDEAYYHLFNRGNNNDPIFHQARDYERFLRGMRKALSDYDVDVHAYCLMPNHYHALVRQRPGGSLASAMKSFMTAYAMYYNKAYRHVGHVFQGRYRVRPIMNPLDLIQITRYIHLNPVNIADYRVYEWSSYRAYARGVADPYCMTRPVLQAFRELRTGSYAAFCRSAQGTDLLLDDQVVEAQGLAGGGSIGVDLEAGVGPGHKCSGVGGGAGEGRQGHMDG